MKHDTESPSLSSQALPPGTRVEEFVIERVLGSGGFGITYLARDTHLDRPVVIKENLPVQFCFRDTHSLTVAPRHTHGDDVDNFQWSLENFSRESAILASLDHPGIVRVLRSFQAFGTAYFVMPFVEGETLDEVAKQRQARDLMFSEQELSAMLDRILDALGHLHGKGIYHRDIKPGNILITNEGLPVLIDFGSARQRLSERSLTVVESAGYTPFEQLQTRGNVGPWSDLYSLGATLVKVITGETPPKTNDRSFGDPWQPLVGREHLKSRYSETFLSGIDRALRLTVEERWQTAEVWKQALISGNVPELGRQTRIPTAAPGKQRSNKSRISAVLAMAAVLLLGFSVWWMKGGQGVSSPKPILFGALVLTSEPSPAKVLDASGQELGVTPLELKDLPGGQAWEGTMEKPGYLPSVVRENVPVGESRLVPPVKLQPQPQKVIISSDPSDAEVVDGDKVLGRTPMETDPREVGESVVLTLRKEGYDDARVSGEVELGKSLMLKGNLMPQAQKVIINSEPSDAEVVEGGKVLGRTPMETDPREVGDSVVLTLRKAGYDDAQVSGDVELGKSLVLKGNLMPQAQKVIVSSDPTGAEVVEGDKVLGRTIMETDLREVGESVVLTLRKEGYDDVQVSGEVELGKSLVLKGNLKVKPRRGGKTPGEEKVIELAQGVKMTFCWCPPGEFMMGSLATENGRGSDEDQVRVTISKGFWMSKTEVTQAQWQAVMGSNPSHFRGTNFPVESVSWNDAHKFLQKIDPVLSAADGLKTMLPTEAQWEYAARAGESWIYSGGGKLDEVAWYCENSGSTVNPVGMKKANAWGLHDMSGNVWEWCRDRYDEKLSGGVDPAGALSGIYRVFRGGGWFGHADYGRVAGRYYGGPAHTGYNIGFRLIRSLSP